MTQPSPDIAAGVTDLATGFDIEVGFRQDDLNFVADDGAFELSPVLRQ